MHIRIKKFFALMFISGLLLVAFLQVWKPRAASGVDIRPLHRSTLKKLLVGKIQDLIDSYGDIPFHINKDVAGCVFSHKCWLICLYSCLVILSHSCNFYTWCSRLAQNTCACLADEETVRLPFSDLLFPPVWAHDVGVAFLESQADPEGTKHHRAQEYNSFQER